MVKYVDYFGHRVSREWNRVLRAADAAGVPFHLDSGHRTMLEQAKLVRKLGLFNAKTNPHGAAAPLPTAPHIRVGRADHAIDVNQLDGGANRLVAWLRKQGVKATFTVPSEPWHIEADRRDLKRFSDKLMREVHHKKTPRKKTTHVKPHPANLIDISSFQGVISVAQFRQIKAAGYEGVIIKATEGQDFIDSRAEANARNARAAGLKVGFYHFLRPRPGRTGAVEAEHFVRVTEEIRRKVGLSSFEILKPTADVEVSQLGSQAITGRIPVDDDTEGLGQMGAYYHENPVATIAGALSRALGEYIEQFLDEAERQLGVRPIIYTFPAFASWGSTHGTDLWIANFGVSRPTIPPPWKDYVMWQHSSTATVPGISGHVDVDHAPDLRKLVV